MKYNQWTIMKSENKDLQNTFDKFTKVRDNLSILLENQIVSYNKVDPGDESNNNIKIFSKICHIHQTPKCKTLKCNYYSKNGHIALFFYIKKSQEIKQGYPPSNFYKEHQDRK